MGFEIVFDGLKKSVSKFAPVYEAARGEHAALAPYATLAELLAALKLSSKITYAERDAITLALIAEQQTKAHPLWPSLLLAAFEPMLRRLRGRVRVAKDEEIEQRIVLAFLEATQRVALHHPPSHAALHLRRETERAVFGAIRRDERTAEAEAKANMDAIPDPRTDETPGEVDTIALDELRQVLADESNGDELYDVLCATLGGDEKLLSYVKRTRPELSPEDRKATYGRLQRQRHRVLVRIRARLGEMPQLAMPA